MSIFSLELETPSQVRLKEFVSSIKRTELLERFSLLKQKQKGLLHLKLYVTLVVSHSVTRDEDLLILHFKTTQNIEIYNFLRKFSKAHISFVYIGISRH